MECSKCKFQNLEELQFRGKCVDPLQQSLDISGINFKEPQSYIPKHLADKILTTRNLVEGESKFLTVLFAVELTNRNKSKIYRRNLG